MGFALSFTNSRRPLPMNHLLERVDFSIYLDSES